MVSYITINLTVLKSLYVTKKIFFVELVFYYNFWYKIEYLMRYCPLFHRAFFLSFFWHDVNRKLSKHSTLSWKKKGLIQICCWNRAVKVRSITYELSSMYLLYMIIVHTIKQIVSSYISLYIFLDSYIPDTFVHSVSIHHCLDFPFYHDINRIR